MQSTASQYFEGIMLSSASVVITYFFVTHLAPGMKTKDQWESKWEKNMSEQIEDTLSGARKNGFFWFTFTSVFREGIESAIFMTSIGAAYMPTALIFPSILGAIVAILFARGMFAGGKKLDLSTFFMASAVLLLFISAGLAAHGSYELQKAGMFGTWACYHVVCPSLLP